MVCHGGAKQNLIRLVTLFTIISQHSFTKLPSDEKSFWDSSHTLFESTNPQEKE